ncbi:hypothetical protein FKM82_021417 [Ascaphus truei]
MSWKDAFITVTFPKKVVLTLMSTLLLILHATVFIKDLYTFTVTQRVDRMNVDYTVVLLVSQVISFYWALLGSIYSLESENSVLSCLALGSLCK